MKTKITDRADEFDECMSDWTPEEQGGLIRLVKWVEEIVLAPGAGEKSAKEFFLICLKRPEWAMRR